MTKYDGIRAVESTLNNNNEVHIIKRKKIKKSGNSALMRWVVCGVILCGLFGLKYVENPMADTVTTFVKEAVTFDLVEIKTAQGERGSVRFVELLKEFLEGTSDTTDNENEQENG